MITELENEDIVPLSDAALGEDLTVLRRAIDRMEYQFSRRLDVFARRQGDMAFGFVTLISWLRRACRLMPGAATQRAETACNLATLPKSQAHSRPGTSDFITLRSSHTQS